jgi:hypothetical protein
MDILDEKDYRGNSSEACPPHTLHLSYLMHQKPDRAAFHIHHHNRPISYILDVSKK